MKVDAILRARALERRDSRRRFLETIVRPAMERAFQENERAFVNRLAETSGNRAKFFADYGMVDPADQQQEAA